MAQPEPSHSESQIPPLDAPMRYGVRPARFTDTGERFSMATIDGKPVAVAPSRAALVEYAESLGLELVTGEMMRHVHRDAADARAFRRLPTWFQNRVRR